MMIIAGISCFYHDSAVAILKDGEILSAAQEERFSRIKHDSHFPVRALDFCLDFSGLDVSDVDAFVFYEKPFTKFGRIVDNWFDAVPSGFPNFRESFKEWTRWKLFQKKYILTTLKDKFGKNIVEEKLFFSNHHLSHAASAFFPSQFKHAAILTIDAVGEKTTSSISLGEGASITPLFELNYPNSVGLLYSTFTAFLGFKVNSGEYKLMGLAPYGKPIYSDLIKKHIVTIFNDGSIHLNNKYFSYREKLVMYSPEMSRLFKINPRLAEETFTQIHLDIAASIQSVLEEIVLLMAKHALQVTRCENICLAGGVALNCTANSRVRTLVGSHKNIFIQPAAGDAGGALGAALALHHMGGLGTEISCPLPKEQKRKTCFTPYLGPEFAITDIKNELDRLSMKYEQVAEMQQVCVKTANYLTEKKVIGWFQGRMEYGPRALGNRSILADPRCDDMQKTLNLKIKFRESFRPFAPAVLEEKASEWFSVAGSSPYMLFIDHVKSKMRQTKQKNDDSNQQRSMDVIKRLENSRSLVPAVTHVDYSARVQTVSRENNPLFHQLIRTFDELTGCPILINTSFNVRGEPIVCSVEDAVSCFASTNMDILVIGNFILEKHRQSADVLDGLRREFPDD